MNGNGARYDFIPFDDDDDDELEVATLLADEDDYEFEIAEDDDDDDELEVSAEMEDDDDDEEIIPGLVSAAIPSIAGGIGKLFRGSRRRKRRVRVRRPSNRGRRIRGRRGRATIMTRRGPVSARLQTKVVTPAELQRALAGVRRDIGAVRTAVRRVDRNAISRDAATRKSTARLLAAERKERQKLNKKLKAEIEQQAQQSMMLSLFQGKPQIQTLKGTIEEKDGTTTFTVNEGATEYRDSNDLLPLALMMGGGFGSSGSGGMNPLMLMALLD